MEDLGIGNIVASRSLRSKDGVRINVYISEPYLHDESNEEYWCKYVIDWGSERKVRYAIGIDSVQSLCLAMKKIGTDLYTSELYRSGSLVWDGGMQERDLGFPVPDVIRDLASG
ncbi:DUF6968 family protein [Sphingosinicella sp. LHD-64]|uniref:DUF6968 family protein n=1 Tax=Sphingosinicella sp. LHD-64 TaxID=3072139 RepID=UPI0035BE6F32